MGGWIFFFHIKYNNVGHHSMMWGGGEEEGCEEGGFHQYHVVASCASYDQRGANILHIFQCTR